MEIDWIAFAQGNLPFILSLMVAGLAAGFLAGLFGIGGGFVVVPALFGILTVLGGDVETRAHVAIGTSLATIILTSLRSVHAHSKRNAVDFDLLKSWAPWIVAGVLGGLYFAAAIDGVTLGVIFAVGVFLLALQMMFGPPSWSIEDKRVPKRTIMAGSATFIGFSSSLLGIGGGTLSVLIMTIFGRSIHQAVATSSGVGFIIAVPGAIGFMIMGWGAPGLPTGSVGYINVIGLIAISVTTLITAPLGASAAHSLDARTLRRAFAGYLMFTSGLMLFESWQASLEHQFPPERGQIVEVDSLVNSGIPYYERREEPSDMTLSNEDG